MAFSVQLVQTLRVIEADTFSAGGRIVDLQVGTVQLTGGSRRHAAVHPLSAGVSNQALQLDPLAASQPGSLLLVQADQPLDLRLNAVSASWLCNIVSLLLAASAAISAVYVTNPQSVDAVVRIEVVGGGALQASLPVP